MRGRRVCMSRDFGTSVLLLAQCPGSALCLRTAMGQCHHGRSKGGPPQKTGGPGVAKLMIVNAGGELGVTGVKNGVSLSVVIVGLFSFH